MHTPDVASILDAMRVKAPLVHCLTGAVSAPFVADGLLAAGARPLMTATIGEAPTLVRGADALLVNLAALGEETAAAILPTVAAARDGGRPWVLDPAVVGPAPVRTPLARNLVRHHPGAIRGNASEIRALAGADGGARGADTRCSSRAVIDDAARLAHDARCVVVVSGELDVITDGQRVIGSTGGDARLTQVTGTGCLLSALVTAFITVATPLDAALTAVALMSSAAEDAARKSAGPGSFKVELLDALDRIGPAHLEVSTRWCSG